MEDDVNLEGNTEDVGSGPSLNGTGSRARPTDYTDGIGTRIVEAMSEGATLLAICQDEDMPSRSTVYRWAEQYEDFREKLSRARNAQAHYYFERMIEVAHDDKQDIFYDNAGEPHIDHARIQRHRLIVDTLKFAAAKLLPKSYGDKLLPEDQPRSLTIRWGGSAETAPPSRHEPPRQLTYAKPELPADLTEADWSVMLDLLEMVKRTIPTNSDKPPAEIFGVMKRALMEHFRGAE
jgi:hypothetical protein